MYTSATDSADPYSSPSRPDISLMYVTIHVFGTAWSSAQVRSTDPSNRAVQLIKSHDCSSQSNSTSLVIQLDGNV